MEGKHFVGKEKIVHEKHKKNWLYIRCKDGENWCEFRKDEGITFRGSRFSYPLYFNLSTEERIS